MFQEQTEIDRTCVEEALKAILASSGFRSSRQCSLLLTYIVTHSLANDDDLLRERVIGAAVFGRPADYDTGNDPIVRSRAGEVRKRLAQFYVEHSEELGVIITIPSGSYRAIASLAHPRMTKADEADLPLAASAPAPASAQVGRAVGPSLVEGLARHNHLEGSRARGSSVLLLLAVLLTTSLAGSLIYFRNHARPETLFQQFWSPLVTPPKPVVLYIGANYAYRLTPEYLDAYRDRHSLQNTGPEFFIDLKPTDSLTPQNLLPTNNLIGFGDVAATARLVSTLTSFKKKYDLRYGNDLGVTDLQSTPVLLVGGFSNPWTMKLTAKLRYTLNHGDTIVDKEQVLLSSQQMARTTSPSFHASPTRRLADS